MDADVERLNRRETGIVSAMMDAEQLARHLNLSVSWIYQMVGKGMLPCYKIGRSLRFDPLEIRAWLGRQKVNS